MKLNPKRNTWRFVSFVPAQPECKRFPPLFFEGRVRWGDLPKPAQAPRAIQLDIDLLQIEQHPYLAS